MITRIIKIHLKNPPADFINYMDAIRDELSLYKGCQNLEVLSDKEDESTFFIYTIWRTENDLNVFRNSTLNKDFWNTLLNMSASRPEVWTVENIFE